MHKVGKADMSTLCVLCVAACRMDLGRVAEPLWGALDDSLPRKIRRAQYVAIGGLLSCGMQHGGGLGMQCDVSIMIHLCTTRHGWQLASVAQSYARMQRHRQGLFDLLAARAVDLAPSMQSKDMLRCA